MLSRLFGQFVMVVPSRTPLLPFIEQLTGWDLMRVGDCRIKNLKAIDGDGKVIIGYFMYNKRLFRHLRVSKEGEIIDYTCPKCEPVGDVRVYVVKDYSLYDENGNPIKMPVINPFIDADRSNLYYVYWALKSQEFIKYFSQEWKDSFLVRLETYAFVLLFSTVLIAIPFLAKRFR
ncbi:hypothetical protein [Persephonella sp. KM09-Lau-8]|uniref:hypothetical protein n=1 Tax=Persephonella sp. KM09-Lau-8 TaxID=1158345 RepID=UPI0012DE8638|nr:hypothetical protein [Persephonella sp. KM09-Lau-8]